MTWLGGSEDSSSPACDCYGASIGGGMVVCSMNFPKKVL